MWLLRGSSLRPLAWALIAGLVVAGAACRPQNTPTPPLQAARVAPATLAQFWTGFTSTDPTKLEAALRLLLETPEIADASLVADWSAIDAAPDAAPTAAPTAAPVKQASLVIWSLADGTTIALDPANLRQLAASIDVIVAATEPDEARRAERRLELLGLVDRVGTNAWQASDAFAVPRGGLFGESEAARLHREHALFEIRSYSLLLRLLVQDSLEKAPPELVDETDLARRKEELRAMRRTMLGKTPNAATP